MRSLKDSTIRSAIFSSVGPRQVAHDAEINLDGGAGIEFVKTLYATWAERMDYSDAWGVIGDDGYGPNFDDRIELRDELTRSAVSGLVWYGHIAQVWTDLRGWELDDEIEELMPSTDFYSSMDRMNLALTIFAERFFDRLYALASEVAQGVAV